MPEQFIQVAPNSTGLKLRVFELTVGANVVEHQVIMLADGSGNIIPLPLALGPGGGFKIDGSLAASQGDAIAQAQAVPGVGHAYIFNGTTWDRVRGYSDTADAVGTTGAGAPLALARETVFNGSSWDRARSASAAALAAQSGIGARMVAPPGNWSVVSAPAVSTVASAVKGAGAAGVRHICTNVSFGFSAGTAVAAATVVVNLRDGASGAGTILKSWQFALPATTIAPFAVSFPLHEVGTAATAMTLEFTALLTNLLQFCNLGGYDAS